MVTNNDNPNNSRKEILARFLSALIATLICFGTPMFLQLLEACSLAGTNCPRPSRYKIIGTGAIWFGILSPFVFLGCYRLLCKMQRITSGLKLRKFLLVCGVVEACVIFCIYILWF